MKVAQKNTNRKPEPDEVGQIMQAAYDIAKIYKRKTVTTTHVAFVLFGKSETKPNIGYEVLEDSGFDAAKVFDYIQSLAGNDEPETFPYAVNQDVKVDEWLSLVATAAKSLGVSTKSELALLLSYFWTDDPITAWMMTQGIDNTVIEQRIKHYVKLRQEQKDKEHTKALDEYGTELVRDMKKSDHDPVIGRDNEIIEVMEILSRKGKNNPLLIGDPGVGKTAIIEGLAQRIAAGDVPDNLKNKKLYSIDLAALVAGAKYNGEFEERFKSLLDEVAEDSDHILLFIDEIHMMMGAGAQGTMDAGNMLKPMLARGQLHLIGATTTDEYREYVEKDKALARRFQQVRVSEPSLADTITILRGLRHRFEIHHQVQIHDNALIAAVNLSDRYINDRFLPDKAIDLIDTACAKIRVVLNSSPADLDKARRELIRLQVEETALQDETDAKSKDRLAVVSKKRDALSQKVSALSREWNRQKADMEIMSKQKSLVDDLKMKRLQAENDGEAITAAKIQMSLKKANDRLQKLVEQDKSRKHMVAESVTEQEIASVISDATGIPLRKLVQSERQRLLGLPAMLSKSVMGQDDAVKQVSKAIWRARANIQDPTKPLGSFLFLGSSGVGKTALAKALAKVLFDSEDALIRFDMSEYMEKESVMRLTGAAPGYIGYEAGGELTEAVRHRPYAIVLFDEVEKAHPDVFNILLQVLDDGRLTDNHKRTVDFKNTIIIMTSNLGANDILESFKNYHRITSETRQRVNERLLQQFRPELINRIQTKLIFSPLSLQIMYSIVQRMTSDLSARLHQQGIKLSFNRDALEWLAQRSYDPQNGARPLQRWITARVEDPIAHGIIAGKIHSGSQLICMTDDTKSKLIFSLAQANAEPVTDL